MTSDTEKLEVEQVNKTYSEKVNGNNITNDGIFLFSCARGFLCC